MKTKHQVHQQPSNDRYNSDAISTSWSNFIKKRIIEDAIFSQKLKNNHQPIDIIKASIDFYEAANRDYFDLADEFLRLVDSQIPIPKATIETIADIPSKPSNNNASSSILFRKYNTILNTPLTPIERDYILTRIRELSVNSCAVEDEHSLLVDEEIERPASTISL